MMKLSLMKAIAATLTDTGESALGNQLLSMWPHDPGTAKFFRTSANALFTFTEAQRPYLLRFNHASEKISPQKTSTFCRCFYAYTMR